MSATCIPLTVLGSPVGVVHRTDVDRSKVADLLLDEMETLADVVGESVATVSHHLGKLKLAGLVTARRAGKHQIYAVHDRHVVELVREAIAHHHDRHHELRDEPRRLSARRDRRGA